MVDNLSPEDRRRTMQAVKGAKTKLERRLFAMLAGMRLKGWRQNVGDLPGKPDVVFDRERVAVFADGCFWHSCRTCKRALPRTNRSYWKRKLDRNTLLMRKATRQLRRQGWVVVRCWEHDLRTSAGRAAAAVAVRTALRKGSRVA